MAFVLLFRACATFKSRMLSRNWRADACLCGNTANSTSEWHIIDQLVINFLPLHVVEIDLQGSQLIAQCRAADAQDLGGLQLVTLRMAQCEHE